jgi:hypothetical protein
MALLTAHYILEYAKTQNIPRSRLEAGLIAADMCLYDATVAPEISNP